MKHLCDDVCFKKFRSNPTEYLRQATPAGTGTQPKTAENKTSTPATPAANQNQQKQTQGAPPPVSSNFLILLTILVPPIATEVRVVDNTCQSSCG